MEMPSVWGVVTPEELSARLARIFSKVESLNTGQGRAGHSSLPCLQRSSETRRQLLQPLHGRSRTTRNDKGLGFNLQQPNGFDKLRTRCHRREPTQSENYVEILLGSPGLAVHGLASLASTSDPRRSGVVTSLSPRLDSDQLSSSGNDLILVCSQTPFRGRPLLRLDSTLLLRQQPTEPRGLCLTS